MGGKIRYQDLSDPELVSLLKKGQEEAFTILYQRHWAIVYQQVYRILRDDDECRDVIQEVFSSLWLKREQLADNTNLGAYLYIQGRNRVFSLIAKNRVRSDYLNSITQFMEKVDRNATDLLEEKEIFARVEQEINRLPPRMREIFISSREEGRSHKEIADALGLSEQTVKKQVHNALKIIKPKLQNLGGLR
ncbi:DNA-directed RNA polymerase sigma-70 factor [Parapedobacter defluvii]|uniref:DNA-directed RNA polymerase sigma-70 factor n=1 Tax=Parapedobacter defluvii TaxID=2045106 RepID=A0ABQ1LML1_9SPHI|nr:RNA polymerase sigma-70 factor [Parapedobacter defluvii]GGC25990.1 DNA-directed RNA polymerase sigma-70 factor [Parapedobacter defluvii]